MNRTWLNGMATFAAGAAGGGLFAAVGLPLPWILGAAFGIMTLNAARPGVATWPRLIGDSGIVVVAYVLGGAMTLGTVQTIVRELPLMALAAGLWTAVCMAIGLLFARLTGLSVQDGVLGSMPGGLTQMVLVADETPGANAGNVAIMQTARLVVVLYTVPFLAAWFAGRSAADPGLATAVVGGTSPEAAGVLAGLPDWAAYAALPLVPLAAWLGRLIHLPAGEFLGPVLVVGAAAAAGLPWPDAPAPLVSAAQLAIGIFIGCRVQPRILLANRRFGPLSLIFAVLLIALTALAALGWSVFDGGSIVTWFLALAPGGLGEMAVTAIVLGADEARVTSYQTFRLLFVLMAAPPLIRLAFRWRRRRTATPE